MFYPQEQIDKEVQDPDVISMMWMLLHVVGESVYFIISFGEVYV